MTRLWLTLTALAAAVPAAAQPAPVPRVEIGGAVSAVLPIVFEDGPTVVAGAGPRLTLNLTPGLGVDIYGEAFGSFDSATSTYGVYGLDLALPLRRSVSGRADLSIVVGAAGRFSYTRAGEHRVTRLDGSIAVHPAYQRLRSDAPTTLSLGVRRRLVVGRRAAVMMAAGTYFGSLGGFAARVTAGLFFGTGGYR